MTAAAGAALSHAVWRQQFDNNFRADLTPRTAWQARLTRALFAGYRPGQLFQLGAHGPMISPRERQLPASYSLSALLAPTSSKPAMTSFVSIHKY
jgi:hypothetical protein